MRRAATLWLEAPTQIAHSISCPEHQHADRGSTHRIWHAVPGTSSRVIELSSSSETAYLARRTAYQRLAPGRRDRPRGTAIADECVDEFRGHIGARRALKKQTLADFAGRPLAVP